MIASKRPVGSTDVAVPDSAYMPPLLPFVPLRMTGAQTTLERATRTAGREGNQRGHTVLVSAPAGSGTTVLMADWLHRRHDDATVGWVDIASLAGDTARLWPAVSAALDLSTGLRAGAIPDTPVDEAAAVVSALSTDATLSTDAGPSVLVLDDAHLITDPLMLAGLEYFVEHAPPSLTTVVAGRFDPPLRWHALEMTARLTRLTGHDLALDVPQVAALLAQHDCHLTDTELATVHRLTRGWAALVRIAAIHLAATPGDRATVLAGLVHTPRAVADFLVDELLTTLTPETREFLLTTAVPTSFSTELATELLGPTATNTLDMLLRNNFPIECGTRDGALWYTYHPMLRTHLLAEAARTDPRRTGAVHRACAGWFTTAAMLPSALDHVFGEPGHPGLTDFVRIYGPRMVFEGNGTPLLRHLDALDIADDPFVRTLRIADAVERADLVQATALREVADEVSQQDSAFVPPNMLLPFVDAVGYEVDMATGRRLTTPATHSPTGHRDLDCYVCSATATAHTLRPGTRRDGDPALRHALVLSEQAGLHHITARTLTRLALSAGLNGSLLLMRERATRAVGFAVDHDLEHTATLVQARLLVALTDYLRGENEGLRTFDIVPVARQLDGSTAPASGWHADLLAHLLTVDTVPDRHGVAETLRAGMDRLLDEDPNPELTAGLLLQVGWVLLRLRKAESTRRMLDRAVAVFGRLPETILVEAALAQDNRRYAAALDLIAPLLDDDRLPPVSATHARLLYASACHHLDRPSAAYEALHRALVLAEADRLVRPFLDVPGVRELLDQFVGRFGHLDEFAESIRHSARARTDAHAPPLTDTELTVLRQLPSGMTTNSLAADMGVSINTVKTHLRGIYHKLGVRTRADAIAHARTLGLI